MSAPRELDERRRRRAELDATATTGRDALVDRWLGIDELPDDGPDLPSDGVPYLPCGVDEILAFVDEVPVTEAAEVVDLGAGLGRVLMLVHLLTGARGRGVEAQSALVARARALATARGLDREVSFVHATALDAPLEGDVFFLYTPFGGETLRRVVARLGALAARRRIVVCAVGVEIHAAWARPRATRAPMLRLYDGGPSKA